MKLNIKFLAAALCMVILTAVGIPAFASDGVTAEVTIADIISGDRLSSWAVDDVSEALAEGLIPEKLGSNFDKTMTRADFCALAVTIYESVKGEITGRRAFVDTDDADVEKAAYVGIANGIGRNRFDPDSMLTREMAAVMLTNLSKAMGQPLPQHAATFTDINRASPWAVDSIGRVQAAGIMNGTGNNRFSPSQQYTREAGIVTVMRMLHIIDNEQEGDGVLFIKTSMGAGAAYKQPVTAITSKSGLEQYFAEIGFVDGLAKYTEDFFTTKYLAVVFMPENSGSNRHRVDSIDADGAIHISRLLPEIGTADMVEWFIVIELDIDFKPAQFNVVTADVPAS